MRWHFISIPHLMLISSNVSFPILRYYMTRDNHILSKRKEKKNQNNKALVWKRKLLEAQNGLWAAHTLTYHTHQSPFHFTMPHNFPKAFIWDMVLFWVFSYTRINHFSHFGITHCEVLRKGILIQWQKDKNKKREVFKL